MKIHSTVLELRHADTQRHVPKLKALPFQNKHQQFPKTYQNYFCQRAIKMRVACFLLDHRETPFLIPALNPFHNIQHSVATSFNQTFFFWVRNLHLKVERLYVLFTEPKFKLVNNPEPIWAGQRRRFTRAEWSMGYGPVCTAVYACKWYSAG